MRRSPQAALPALALWWLCVWAGAPLAQTVPDGHAHLTEQTGRIQGLLAQGKATEAWPLAQEALEFAQRRFGPDTDEAGAAWSDAAEILRLTGHLREAAQAFERAETQLSKRPKQDLGLATLRYRRAELLRMQGKPSEALTLYQQVEAVYVAQYGSNNTAVATCWNAEAEMLRMLGRPQDALPVHDRAVAAFVQAAGAAHPFAATAMQARATSLQALGKYAQARAEFAAAHAIDLQALGAQHPWTATLANNLGEIERLMGLPADAEVHFRAALQAYEATAGPQHPFTASALVNLGNVVMERGRDLEAAQLLARARKILADAEGEDHPDMAGVLLMQAELARVQGKPAQAGTLLETALAIREKRQGPMHPDVAYVLDALAGVALERGDHAAVERWADRSLAVRGAALGADHPETTRTLLILAQHHVQLGDLAHAEPLLRQALARAEAGLGPQHPRVGQVADALGALLYAVGQPAEAAAQWRRTRSIAEATYGPKHLRTASALGNLAAAAWSLGKREEALQLLHQSADIEHALLPPQHPSHAVTLHNLAMMEAGAGQWKPALERLKLAESLERAALPPGDPALAQTLVHRAGMLTALGRHAQALVAERGALAVLDTQLTRWLGLGTDAQKSALIAQQQRPLWQVVGHNVRHLSRDPKATRLALDAVLRRKGLAVDAMADTFALLRARSDKRADPLLEAVAEARQQLATLALRGPGDGDPAVHAVRVAEVSRELEAREQALARQSRTFRSQLAVPRSADVQAKLAKNAALVEWVWYRPEAWDGATEPPRYAAYVLRATGEPVAVDLGDAATIEAAVTHLRELIADPRGSRTQAETVRQAAAQLTALVLTPLQSALGDAVQWWLAPDAALSLVPFAALLDTDGRWVVERRTVTLLGSGRELLRAPAEVERIGDAVVLADPDFDDDLPRDDDLPADVTPTTLRGTAASTFARLKFRPLQGTAEEADAVVPLLRAVRLVGRAATESALRRHHGPRILHIATHGWFLPAPPPPPSEALSLRAPTTTGVVDQPLLRSGLALAGFNHRRAGADDGALTALEAMGLDLNGTQLVVLSACNTGVGDTTAGAGVYGLRRAFAMAGAESLLMSLWSVDDQATRALMTSFYGKLSAGEARSEALRRAQLELLGQPRTQAPFFWAAFQLAGDGRVMH